jgi:hypothetical protein
MGKTRTALPLLWLMLLACGHDSVGGWGAGSLRIVAGDVVVSRSGGPDARISPSGGLRIGRDEIDVSATQRAKLVAYHDAAVALTEDAAATGRAGADVGVTAAREVAGGLARGDASAVGGKLGERADAVRRAASKLCADAHALRSAQDALVAELPSFRPYASIHSDGDTDCPKETPA